MVGHADGRLALAAEAECLVGVRWRGAGHGVGVLLGRGLGGEVDLLRCFRLKSLLKANCSYSSQVTSSFPSRTGRS